VPYDSRFIDLEDPPDWFHTISPFGKVRCCGREAVLFESAIINEYLDEVYPPRLHPPIARAGRQPSLIEFGSTLLVNLTSC